MRHACDLFYECDCVNCICTHIVHLRLFIFCSLIKGCRGSVESFCVMWSTLLSLYEQLYLCCNEWLCFPDKVCVCVPFLISVYVCVCTLPWSPLSLSPPQPYVPTEEEQMAPLPPNPFSELSEQDMEAYRKNVERRQLGLSGTSHKDAWIHTQTQTNMQKRWSTNSRMFMDLILNSFALNLQTPQESHWETYGLNTLAHTHTHTQWRVPQCEQQTALLICQGSFNNKLLRRFITINQ